MTSSRTQVSYLSPAMNEPTSSISGGRKLRKEPRDYDRTIPKFNSGYGIAASSGAPPLSSSSSQPGHLSQNRIQASIQLAKERRQARHEAKNGNEITRRGNLVIDEDGIAHDSEYKQFRTATPVHVHHKRNQSEYPDDDGSASSSSSGSDSEDSRFPSSPYTYQSTRTTASNHHYSSTLGTTASAIPPYLQPKSGRSSFDYPSSSLAVPHAPSPRRASADYDRSPGGYGSSSGSSLLDRNGRTRNVSTPQFTTSSFQPPAPAFNPRPLDFSTSLRLPPKTAGVAALAAVAIGAPAAAVAQPGGVGSSVGDARSITDSMAALGVEDGSSGYNKVASDSTRPPKMDGSVLAAGTHGMKRSWDGFKLEMKFSARSTQKKLERKLGNLL